MRQVADEVTLTLPREPEFQRVAHLVLGGLAVRLNLTIENLEDMQIALDSLLEREDGDGSSPITVRMSPTDSSLVTLVGPFSSELLEEIDRDLGDELGLRRVLESTVDEVDVDGESVKLTMRVARG
jgi:hypothetical protein